MKGRKFLKSRTRRLLSWTGLAVALPALWACTTRSLEMPELKPAKNNTFTFQESVNRDIDILFMIDNSSSMAKSQANLVRNFPTFMNVLKMLPGGLPNVHIAVVSSAMPLPEQPFVTEPAPMSRSEEHTSELQSR